MNPAGLVLVIAGIWVTSQVLGGNALQRMGIIKPAAPDDGGGGLFPNVPGLPSPGDLVPGGKLNPAVPLLPNFGG